MSLYYLVLNQISCKYILASKEKSDLGIEFASKFLFITLTNLSLHPFPSTYPKSLMALVIPLHMPMATAVHALAFVILNTKFRRTLGALSKTWVQIEAPIYFPITYLVSVLQLRILVALYISWSLLMFNFISHFREMIQRRRLFGHKLQRRLSILKKSKKSRMRTKQR